MTVDTTIFIRAKNESAFIGRCLRAISEQDQVSPPQVIVLDSGSEDDTVAQAKHHGARVYRIPPEHFSYAAALNLGVELSQGEIFVPLSAHAIPQNSSWLAKLLQPLREHPEIAASYSQQRPWPDACPSELRELHAVFPQSDQIRKPSDLISALSDESAFYRTITFSNASSAIRRSVLNRFPFRAMPFSEDRAFAIDCLANDFSIAYTSNSCVFHSHAPDLRSFYQIAKRASVARVQLMVLAHSYFPACVETLNRHSLPQASLLRALLILPYALAAATAPLLRTTFAKNQRKQGLYREAAYRIAQIGTSWGKYMGLRQSELNFPQAASIDTLRQHLQGPL